MTVAVILFIVCILASSIGAIVGAGGGVIIKPVLDYGGTQDAWSRIAVGSMNYSLNAASVTCSDSGK